MSTLNRLINGLKSLANIFTRSNTSMDDERQGAEPPSDEGQSEPATSINAERHQDQRDDSCDEQLEEDNSLATHEANVALYRTLSIADPISKRPALPLEIILQILDLPSRWVVLQSHAYPDKHSQEDNAHRDGDSSSEESSTTDTDSDGGDEGDDDNDRERQRPATEANHSSQPGPAPDKTTKSTATNNGREIHCLQNPPTFCITNRASPKRMVWTSRLTASEIARVRKVVFEIEGHDQGWSSFPDERGGFANSWTWYEAVVTSGAGEEWRPAYTGQASGANDESLIQSWDIQRNRHASSAFELYRVEMDADSELVKSLQDGVIIELYGCARFPGWQCYIESAKIELQGIDDLNEPEEHGILDT